MQSPVPDTRAVPGQCLLRLLPSSSASALSPVNSDNSQEIGSIILISKTGKLGHDSPPISAEWRRGQLSFGLLGTSHGPTRQDLLLWTSCRRVPSGPAPPSRHGPHAVVSMEGAPTFPGEDSELRTLRYCQVSLRVAKS